MPWRMTSSRAVHPCWPISSLLSRYDNSAVGPDENFEGTGVGPGSYAYKIGSDSEKIHYSEAFRKNIHKFIHYSE